MSHLKVTANHKSLRLPADFSISIEERNPLFNDVNMFSYPVQVPLEGNRFLVDNIEDKFSDVRPISIENTPMSIFIDDVPFADGVAKINEDEQIQDSISINIDASEQSLSDLIGDLTCQQVPIPEKYKNDLKIGEKIGAVQVTASYRSDVRIDYPNASDTHYIFTGSASGEVTPQALGFSYPGEDKVWTSSEKNYSERSYPDGKSVNIPVLDKSFINVSEPYGNTIMFDDGTTRQALYCNSRVCYKHYAKEDDGSSSDSIIERKDSTNQYEDIYPYWVLDADRPQSGICFYVLFFLECLFQHLGVSYDISALKNGDLMRLVFFTTHCKYDEEPIMNGTSYRTNLSSKSLIEKWLDSHGCGGEISVENPDVKNLEEFYVNNLHYVVGGRNPEFVFNKVRSISVTTKVTGYELSTHVDAMYANNENFPEMSVTSLLSSLENMFGIRFDYDYYSNKVTAIVLRDVYRNTSSPISLNGSIVQCVKMSEKITGVKVGYSAESDSDEQQENVDNGVKDYDTSYDYIDYPDDIIDLDNGGVIDRSSRHTVIGSNLYKDIINNPANNDLNVYIDRTTGNKYRVKIDSNYTSNADMHPVIFEVGQYKGVEEGDCSKANEDFITEMRNDFEPLPMNDVNYYNELVGIAKSNTVYDEDGNVVSIGTLGKDNQPILVPFVDEDMEHEFIKQKIRQILNGDNTLADVYVTMTLQCRESYDPSNTDDGNSPLQSIDWGNAIAIMRGGGNTAKTEYYDFNYDGFGNSKWKTIVGNYSIGTDSIDPFGEIYDYNGEREGLAVSGMFSLKPRSYVAPFPTLGPLVADDQIDTKTGEKYRVKTRGYVDVFLREHIHFLLNRKKYYIEYLGNPTELAQIRNNWFRRFAIGGLIGYIDNVKYEIDNQTGLNKAQIELYAI